MASVASQLIEEVTAHVESDSLEDAQEICADGTYSPNNLHIIKVFNSYCAGNTSVPVTQINVEWHREIIALSSEIRIKQYCGSRTSSLSWWYRKKHINCRG